MADIAQLGFAVDTAGLKDGKASMDALVPAAVKLQTATEKVNASFTGTSAAASNAARGFNSVGNAATAASKPVFRVAEGYDILTGKMNSNFLAINKNISKMRAASSGIDDVGKSLKFTAREGLGFSRQFADIGVTAAMGMNPLMIAIQQGPQLFDILQEKAITSGTTISAVFRAAGVAIWTALAPLLPIIAAIAAAIGAVVAVFGLMAREGNKANGDIAAGLDLTEKQMKKLEKAGVDTSITMGDSFKGFFVTIGDYLKEGFEGPLKWLSDAWTSTLDSIVQYSVAGFKVLAGTNTATVYAIAAVWQDIPAVIGDLMIQAANYGIDAVKGLLSYIASVPGMIYDFLSAIPGFFSKVWSKAVNLANDALAWLWEKITSGLEWMRQNWQRLPSIIADAFYQAANKAIGAVSWLVNKVIDGINSIGGSLSHMATDGIANPYAGAAGAALKKGTDAAVAGYKAAGDAVDDFGRRWSANNKKIAEGRIRLSAGDAEKGSPGAKGPKSDAAKFEDIVTGAQNDIAAQKARAEAVQLSAEAAATLEQKTKLLNEAETKGIALTDGMRQRIDELAAAYGKAKVAADNAIALRDILKGADGDIAGLKSQAELIGLVGRQLAYQTEMQKLLNDAKAKGLTVDAGMRSQFEGKANQVADQSQANAHSAFMDEITKGAAERMTLLEQERAAIGLGADQVNRLRIENEMLAQARQKNIDLTPADVAAIGQVAKEQAAVEESIRKTREALDFAKDTAKGFFKDIVDGLSKGKSLWSSFGEAALNALQKITDKLIDEALNAAIDALFSAIGSGYAKGGVFGNGGVQEYAKGGTFTNSVVDKPTMFASGGTLGVMGEAGPEAIVPLKRGDDGSLGVQMHGAGAGGATVINAPVTVNNDNRVTGAVSSADIVALQRASAEQTKAQMKRDIPNIIREYQTNGAIV